MTLAEAVVISAATWTLAGWFEVWFPVSPAERKRWAVYRSIGMGFVVAIALLSRILHTNG